MGRCPPSSHPACFEPAASPICISRGEPSRAADFYEAVFAWTPRRDSDEPAFSDATGHVIGHFIAGDPAPDQTGILPLVYVEDVDAALARIERYGGSVARSARPEGSLRVATFRDPEGNLIGLWTEIAS
jgi:predicted enzyme related to lactoylglutathione lyase